MSGRAVLAALLFSCASLQAQNTLRVLTTELPDAVAGHSYRFSLKAVGGKAPHTWSLQGSNPPTGLALNPKTGEITGIPAVADDYGFTVLVADSGEPATRTATQFLRLHVANLLVIDAVALQPAVLGSPYTVRFTARGGTARYRWEAAARLPDGLTLDPYTGVLSGTPSIEGDFVLAVRVVDSAKPPQVQARTFTARIYRPLAVDWVRPPIVDSGGIRGSARAWNSTPSNLDLTLVVVAVNEYGKAFTLGYQKFLLEANRATAEIPFGFNLPRGTYTVHVDAVGEFAPRNAIFRSRRQQGPLRVD